MASAKERLQVQIPADLKELVEQAARALGMTVSSFATSALSRCAHEVIDDQNSTELTNHDWQLFLRLLEDQDAKPNAALVRAAKRHKRSVV